MLVRGPQHAAARLGDSDRVRGPTLHDPIVDRNPEGEQVGIHRWSALIVGFVGVLIITQPGAHTLTYGALFALGNAVLISTVAIAIRRMSGTESTETLTLYQMSVMTVCTAGCWRSVSRAGMRRRADTRAFRDRQRNCSNLVDTLTVIGTTLGRGRSTTCRSYGQRSSARGVGRCAGPDLLAGSAIVIGSGLYILWRETLASASGATIVKHSKDNTA